MAAALDEAWGDVDLSGVVVTRYGHAVPAGRIQVLEASHPVPDHMSLEAGRRMLECVQNLGPDDLVVALMSGGGSSLLIAPAGGMTMEDKQAVNRALLVSGATISEMNAIRRRLSRIKGGRLAEAARPARVATLLISDVPGDLPSEVASGPTVPEHLGAQDALEIAMRYGMDLPASAWELLRSKHQEVQPGEARFDARIIASPQMALAAAAEAAERHGVQPLILGDALEGEARELGRVMAGIAMSVKTHGQPVHAPAVILSGGEATVTMNTANHGRGGRNTEFLLSMALELNAAGRIWAMAGDSDGIDGVEDAAGAFIGPHTLRDLLEAGVAPRDYLMRHDSYSAFSSIDDLLVTGPTLTNVNDIRAVLVA